MLCTQNSRRPALSSRSVQRLSIPIPPAAPYHGVRGGDLAVSPDGARLVYVGSPGNGARQLYLRELDQLNPVAMPGTEGAWNPFFSPNGEWVGFFADADSQEGTLKKVAVGAEILRVPTLIKT